MCARGFQAAIQRKQAIAGGEASPDLESAINSAKGSGQPLDAKLQQSMGQAMGADFNGVRVHTNAKSDRLNQSIQARAFTTGQDVFFREGAYQPGSRGGQELIAHELTHVMQQNGKNVVRSNFVPQQYLLHKPLSRPAISQMVVQRDINGEKDYGEGKLEINFAPTEKDNYVGEEGDITFTPYAKEGNLEKIYLEQSVRTTRMEFNDELLTPIDPRLWDMAVGKGEENEGYYVDNVTRGLVTKEQEDPEKFEKQVEEKTLHYYINAAGDDYEADEIKDEKGNDTVGKRIGQEIVSARLHDTPMNLVPLKYDFFTSAQEHSSMERLGHVSWGFEIKEKNAEKKEVTNEYVKFLEVKDQKVNSLQNQVRELFYEALKGTQWKDPVVPDYVPDLEKRYKKKLYEIFRMTEFKDEVNKSELSVEEMMNLVKDNLSQDRPWQNLYDEIVEKFPEGKSFDKFSN